MSSLAVLVLRVSLVYVVLLILLRLVGKRTVKEATPLDFVVALIVGDCPALTSLVSLHRTGGPT